MNKRAEASGIRLSDRDASIVKGMLMRGDRQHDIAAWFGVNGGRIAEVATGSNFSWISPEQGANLPLKGPYPNGRQATLAMAALKKANQAIESAISEIKLH